jgi:hypothetical protein
MRPMICLGTVLLLVVDPAHLARATSGMGWLLVLSGIPVCLLRAPWCGPRAHTRRGADVTKAGAR